MTRGGKGRSVVRAALVAAAIAIGAQAARCALAWRLTGKPEYLAKAKRMLTVSIAAYGEAYRNRRAEMVTPQSGIFAERK